MVSETDIKEGAGHIRNGGAVAFPTETYYGIGVNPFDEAALARLFALKKRPLNKPLLLIARDERDLDLLAASVPELFRPLMKRWWPGPLTLVFPAREGLSALLTGNTGTIGVRISSHPVARRLVELVGGPVTATSANLSGNPPASSANEVARQFDEGLDYIIDGGETPGVLGSTLVGIDGQRLCLIREGAVPADKILLP